MKKKKKKKKKKKQVIRDSIISIFLKMTFFFLFPVAVFSNCLFSERKAAPHIESMDSNRRARPSEENR